MGSVPSSLAAMAGVLIAAFVPCAHAAPSIQNGDFEDVQIAAPFFSTDPADIPGWTHAGTVGDALLWGVGYSDGGGSITVAGHGNQFVTLGGGFDVPGSASWTSNTISGLVPGQTYDLTFDIANEGGDVGGPQTITLAFNSGATNGPQGFTAPQAFANYWRIWLPESESFVATGTTASITFSVTNQPEDMGLDFVQVVPAAVGVPEPASLVLLVTGLVGLGAIRRRRSAV